MTSQLCDRQIRLPVSPLGNQRGNRRDSLFLSHQGSHQDSQVHNRQVLHSDRQQVNPRLCHPIHRLNRVNSHLAVHLVNPLVNHLVNHQRVLLCSQHVNLLDLLIVALLHNHRIIQADSQQDVRLASQVINQPDNHVGLPVLNLRGTHLASLLDNPLNNLHCSL